MLCVSVLTYIHRGPKNGKCVAWAATRIFQLQARLWARTSTTEVCGCPDSTSGSAGASKPSWRPDVLGAYTISVCVANKSTSFLSACEGVTGARVFVGLIKANQLQLS